MRVTHAMHLAGRPGRHAPLSSQPRRIRHKPADLAAEALHSACIVHLLPAALFVRSEEVMLRRSLVISLITVTSLGAAPLASAQQGDPLQLLRMLQQRAGQPPQQAYAPIAAAPALPAMTEAQLAQTLAAWPAQKGPFAVEKFRDGFNIEGRRVLDPEGRIVKSSVDQNTGDAGYLIETAPDAFRIKLMRYKGGAPMTLATAYRQAGLWTVETVTGVRAVGARLNVNARGFMIARENSLFKYVAGEGLLSYGLPEAFTMAPLQNGNVATTGWVLLEKRAETVQEEAGLLGKTELGSLWRAVKAVGAAAGVSKSDSDYALYNLESNKSVPIGISFGEKQSGIVSQCQNRNMWVAMCDRYESVESAYQQDGSPNRGHYYWRVSWFNTPEGNVAVVMEDGITKVDAIQLDTGKRASVFQRTLGIGDWSCKQELDGRVSARATLGFSQGVNEDVGALLRGDTAVSQR
jgi:hypothetical protein